MSINTSPYEIYIHWTHAGAEDIKALIGRVPVQVRTLEADQPKCFACEALGKAPKKPRDQRDYWNKSKRLERSHIIPEALGGQDSPDNLVLLCRNCNMSNPETKSPFYFWRWIESKFNPFGLEPWVWRAVWETLEEASSIVKLDHVNLEALIVLCFNHAKDELLKHDSGDIGVRDQELRATISALIMDTASRVADMMQKTEEYNAKLFKLKEPTLRSTSQGGQECIE